MCVYVSCEQQWGVGLGSRKKIQMAAAWGWEKDSKRPRLDHKRPLGLVKEFTLIL